jgi:cell division transport system permease protein
VSTLWYGLKQGIKSIIQNKIFSLAAIGTITACLFLLGVFYSLFTNFQHMVYNAESTVSVIVFFDENATQAQIESIGKSIESDPSVEKVEFVSADEAWSRFKSEMLEGESELVEAFGTDNPLSASSSYEVYLNDVSSQAQLVSYIEGMNGVRKVNSSANAAAGFNSFNMLIGYISVSIILLLILISIFLIYSAVDMGINVRKDEIAIMKLIGATDLFVRLPFIVEGIVMGLIGAAIPLGIMRVLYERVVIFITNHFSTLSEWLAFLDTGTVFRVLVPLSMGIGVGIGVLGSTMSVRKHLHV